MKISEFIRQLQETMRLYGDIEIERIDGVPFSLIQVLDDRGKVIDVRGLSK